MAIGPLVQVSTTAQNRLRTLSAVMGVILLLGTASGGFISAQEGATSNPQPIGKAPKAHIGSAMAVLATLEQAQVLPPENTPAANRIIKSVIQFQSAFIRSGDPAIQAFAARALAKKEGDRAEQVLAQVQTTGWNAALLEALADAESQTTTEELQRLEPGLSRFNLSTNDFHHFMQLVREAQGALAKQGFSFQQVFASHRQTMPGANVQP